MRATQRAREWLAIPTPEWTDREIKVSKHLTAALDFADAVEAALAINPDHLRTSQEHAIAEALDAFKSNLDRSTGGGA